MTDAATSKYRASMTTFVVAVLLLSALPFPASAQRQMEALGRGVVAVRGDTLEVFPAYSESAFRAVFFG